MASWVVVVWGVDELEVEVWGRISWVWACSNRMVDFVRGW